MRFAYCGHSYHRVTRSHAFILDALRPGARIDEFWDEEWLTGAELDLAPVLQGGYDAVVVWQVEALVHRLARAGHPNVTFFPMYDGCHAMPDSWWRALTGVKIVCFSSTLHERLQRLGLRSRHVRYFPEPAPGPGVDHEHGLSGFFWQRQRDVTWTTVRALLGETPFRITLHQAMDPSYGEAVAPGEADLRRWAIRRTRWFPSHAEMRAELLRHPVYFAPRLREGIGLSFLEAMAMGALVVAPDRPTMNEYLVSGVDGLLYDPEDPRPLDFSRHAELGARARRSIEWGRARWLRALPRLMELVATPAAAVAPRAPLDALDPWALPLGEPAAPHAAAGAPRPGGRARPPLAAVGPLVTVAVVTRNAAATLAATLDGILAQDWPALEVIVQDGASDDGTVEIIRRYADRLDGWRSEPDGGPYEAMNAVAARARGEYVLFMNAGDGFSSTDALSRLLRGAPPDATVIHGHHVYRDLHGFEEVHRAAAFDETWAALRAGRVGWRWLSAVPGHQATLTRTAFLRGNPYRTDLRLAADHELLYRAARQGERFHHSGETVAVYAAGGLSWRNRTRCLEEWRRIALEYTEHPERAAPAFDRMQADMLEAELPHMPARQLLACVGRVRGATRELKRRLRRRAQTLVPALRPRRRLRITFGEASPEGVRATEGLSRPEGWGRWTEGRHARIELEPGWNGPARALLEIQDVFGPNVGRPLLIRLGPRTYVRRLRRGRQRVRLELPGPRNGTPAPIELEIPEPASPLGWGCGDDPRLLGVALRALEIRLRSS